MYYCIILTAAGLLVAADQFTKWLAVQHLASGPAFSLWDGVLEFTYSENTGIAWGMLKNSRWIVSVATALMLIAVLYILMSGKIRHQKLLTFGTTLVLAGGLGNLIDRVFNGYVVDFIHYYKWFDFPVFNLADCCITVGAILILIALIFFNKEDEKEETAGDTVPLDARSGSDQHTD